MHAGCGSWRAHLMQPGILARVLTLWMHVLTLGEGGAGGGGGGGAGLCKIERVS